ncbi:MAG: hypothetical protein WDZ76_05120 [Pseudohongiellaceae bacterium]
MKRRTALNGKRTGIARLNTKVGGRGRVHGLLQNVSLFMAGMYTGVRCSGTPRDHVFNDADSTPESERDHNPS